MITLRKKYFLPMIWAYKRSEKALSFNYPKKIKLMQMKVEANEMLNAAHRKRDLKAEYKAIGRIELIEEIMN